MSVRDSKQPYMVYEGPLPRRHARPEPLAADLAHSDDERADTGSRGRGFGVGLVVAGALAMGLAIGLWAAPSLRQPDTAPQPEPAVLAMSVTQPTEAPPPASLDLRSSIEPALEDAPKTETVKTAKAVSSRPARVAAAPQKARKVARNDAVKAPKAETLVRTRAPRTELADWLAGEQAARSSASEPADVREDPLGELIATAEEPPHP
jgi:hypothetical protein